MAKRSTIESFVICESGAARLCGLSASTLARYRKSGYGPNFIAIPSPDGTLDPKTGLTKTRFFYEKEDYRKFIMPDNGIFHDRLRRQEFRQ